MEKLEKDRNTSRVSSVLFRTEVYTWRFILWLWVMVNIFPGCSLFSESLLATLP